ncbi:MAG: hypothetical protein M1834_006692 [Cirrosporium novae-zelandiae]|nr:MAG: hypothetical protein M1834_006692 [Cirrosporium novae-zelandiae]
MTVSRSAADATRFTPTGPHAAHQPSNRPHFAPGPPGETPAQKVARLREARRKQQLAQVSKFDRIVDRGRIWADRAHRFTALSLIAATGIAGFVTIYSLTDMIVYNRRKTKLFYEEQRNLRAQRLAAAKEAAASGTLNEDQLLLLNQERAAEEAEAAKQARGGIFKRTKDFLLGGLKKEDVPESTVVESISQSSSDLALSTEKPFEVVQAVDSHRGKAEKESHILEAQGNELEKLGENTAQTSKKSWSSWFGGR